MIWLFKRTKFTKIIKWHGSTDFIRKIQIVNYCISTFYNNNNIFQNFNVFMDWIMDIIIKSMTLIPNFIFRLTIDILLKLAMDHHDNVMSKVKFEPWPFWPQSKAFVIQPQLHVMSKNDIEKYINTHVFWISCIIIWLHILIISYIHWDLLLF
jgi:hypothetical protein